MITLLAGENSFEIDRELQRISAEFGVEGETIDGSELEPRHIPDLLMGTSLFMDKRLVIIKNLSENKTVWTDFSWWLERLSDDIHLVLVESKFDKRTKTAKDLQEAAHIKEFRSWSDRDGRVAEDWVMEEARRQGVELSHPLAKQLVQRAGVNQWKLFHGIQKLSVLDEISVEIINEVIALSSAQNVFLLFETALKGDSVRLHEVIRTLELTEDPFKVFGLLAGQAFQLMSLAVSDKPRAEVAGEIEAHPFVLQKLAPFADRLGKAGAKKVLFAISDADSDMKSTSADPWLLIERALQKIATI